MQKALWAVMCGNIRDELDFKLTMTKLVELRSQKKIDHILLSTWRDEIDKYDGLRGTLKKLKIFIIENYPLSDELQKAPTDAVNFWRQSRQLLAALDAIPKDSFILRVRTDRSLNYINQMEELKVFDNYVQDVPQYGNFPKILKYKIYVFSPKMVRLMHMIDFVFLGYSKDLYKLVNFDVNELMFQKGIVANAQWFMNPFIEEFPILRDYMRFTIFNNTIKVLKEHVDEYKEKSIFPDVYYKVYALYIMIIYTHFKILYMGKINNNFLKDTHFYQFFSTSPGNNLYSTRLGTSIRNENVLEYAIEGKLVQSESYSRFLQYIHHAIVHGTSSGFDYNFSDHKNLVEFVTQKTYGDNKEKKWYKSLKSTPLDMNNIYYENISEINELNCINCDTEIWNNLVNASNIEQDLVKQWLDISDPEYIVTEKMLLPSAKTGNEASIIILLDMLIKNLITKESILEIIRVVEFYLNIHINKKTNSNMTLRLAYKYYDAILSNKISDPKIKLDKLFKCVYSKYNLDLNEYNESYINILLSLIRSDEISDEDKIRFQSILIDYNIERESNCQRESLSDFYKDPMEKIIVSKKYLKVGL